MDNTDMERYFAKPSTHVPKIPRARPKQLSMKTKKKVLDPMPVDNERPKIDRLKLRQILPTAWNTVAANQKNLKEAQLQDFLTIPFQEQDDHQVRQFLKNSNYGSHSNVLIHNYRIQFTPESVARLMNLHQGDGTIDTEVGDLREEDRISIFQKNHRTSKGFVLARAKGIWKEWLPL